ncbi:Protein T04A11.11 [Phytophthora palmivora]|uniref:Protein T04A11.11 n=1 Tax=Phytophthora palmivora TaxID=4796 RepID=A0A2P4YTA2_9STRA|nr:Protein T04A11.11 [Phytophthora palmivora]
MIKSQVRLNDDTPIIYLGDEGEDQNTEVDWFVFTQMENTLPLNHKAIATRQVWVREKLLLKDAGSIGDTSNFSDEKKWKFDVLDGFYTIRGTCVVLPDGRRESKLERLCNGLTREVTIGRLIGKQNLDNCVYTVSELFLPCAHYNYGTDFTYQQDNASIHTSNRTKEFFREQHEKLKAALFEAWDSLSLVESMPRKCLEVVAKNGEPRF